MAGDQNKGESAPRKASTAAAPSPAVAVTGAAALITTEAEAAITTQAEAAAPLHALDQRLREVLVALPPARASVDEVSELGIALKALSTLLT